LSLVLVGCTPGGVSVVQTEPPTPSPSPSPSSSQLVPIPSTAPPVEPVEIEFEFQVPDEVCVPVSELAEVAPTGEWAYALDDELLTHMDDRIVSSCLYGPADVLGRGEDGILLEDHVVLDATIRVFRDRTDSPWAAVYSDLPVASGDLDDWAVAIVYHRDLEGWREGCLPDGPCAEGERPTVRTDAWQTRFAGFVGNMEFYVMVSYVSRNLPDDVVMRNLGIFRELVLAEVDRRAKREVD